MLLGLLCNIRTWAQLTFLMTHCYDLVESAKGLSKNSTFFKAINSILYFNLTLTPYIYQISVYAGISWWTGLWRSPP